MNGKAQKWADHLTKNFSGPMTDEEIDFLRDAQAMIEFGIQNGLSFAVVAGSLCHDLNEIARNMFELKAAKARGFTPKVTGARRLTEEAFGESEVPLE